LRRFISGIDVTEEFEGRGKDRKLIGYTNKLRFRDTLRALELAGKHIDVNAFKEQIDNTHSGPGGGPLITKIERVIVDATKSNPED
jgi:phage terminase small subunit